MNILIINRAMGTLIGGGEQFDLSISARFRARGHSVKILTATSLFNRVRSPAVAESVISLRVPNLRRLAYRLQRFSSLFSALIYHVDNVIFEYRAFRWWRAHRNFDIVQCCSLFRLPLRLASCSTPIVSWLPGPPSRHTCRQIRRLLNYPCFGLFCHGASVWALNQKMGLHEDNDFQDIPPGVQAIPSPSAGERCARRKQLGISPQAVIGITTARLVPVKSVNVILEAVAIARKSLPNLHWIFVGDGPLYGSLKKHAHRLGLDSWVQFTGQLAHSEVTTLLPVCDLFALASQYESYSLAVLEAAAAGLPVLVPRTGYLEHLVESGGIGITVSELSPDAFANEIVALCSKQSLYSSIALRCRAFAMTHSWDRTVSQLEAYYARILHRTANAQRH